MIFTIQRRTLEIKTPYLTTICITPEFCSTSLSCTLTWGCVHQWKTCCRSFLPKILNAVKQNRHGLEWIFFVWDWIINYPDTRTSWGTSVSNSTALQNHVLIGEQGVMIIITQDCTYPFIKTQCIRQMGGKAEAVIPDLSIVNVSFAKAHWLGCHEQNVCIRNLWSEENRSITSRSHRSNKRLTTQIPLCQLNHVPQRTVGYLVLNSCCVNSSDRAQLRLHFSKQMPWFCTQRWWSCAPFLLMYIITDMLYERINTCFPCIRVCIC